eukprot:TRINITY_DN2619_c0_g1_i2.p1 TRINITY_DN2619_c0_g1~~TRINITY_DN2619_c0_g1_i2.p1  ORF type:complete len:403 (+),score=-19.12 TRINITY_DN2619_c0_g1_i2:564-1772(+)
MATGRPSIPDRRLRSPGRLVTVEAVSALLLLVLLAHHPLAAVGGPPPKVRPIKTAHHNGNNAAGGGGLRGWWAQSFGKAVSIQQTGGPIRYYGGPVVLGGPAVNVYLIYYGNWPAGSGQNIIENFVQSLSSASGAQGASGGPTVKNWWAITSNYYMTSSGVKKYVSSQVRLAGVAYDSYSQGKALSSVFNVVKGKVGSGKTLPLDSNGIYMVITSKDVTYSGYCSRYCGWHTYDYISSTRVVYGFVPDHTGCSGCITESVSPNGNVGIDATVSTLAHEITEAATDPDVSSGWMDSSGEENADLCSWAYGSTLSATDSRGRSFRYNMVGNNGMKFLTQLNWDRVAQKCVAQNSLPNTPTPTPAPPPPSPPPPSGSFNMNCQCTCGSGTPMNCQCSCAKASTSK